MKTAFWIMLFYISSWSQTDYPRDYFRSPLDIPMELSGCFGELRPNHFHSGFDMRTNKQEGLNVYAVADGYVSRIKISTFGYGKAIYITHPNGFTSLYGHLKSGVGAIESFIKSSQHQQQSYEIELFLKPEDLPIKKGDIIALSGNTGGSGGPHLHFEFRDSKNDNIINPMFFGYDRFIKDTKNPTISSLFVYPINDNSVVNQSNKLVSVNFQKQADGSYLAQKIKANGKIGFGISTFDSFDNAFNKYGIYKISVSSNQNPIFQYEFDSFAFEEFRYINALLDYSRLKIMNQRIQKLFMKKPYPLKMIKTDNSNGIIDVTVDNLNTIYKIKIEDFKGNKTEVLVPIEYSDLSTNNLATIKKSKYFVNSNNENIFALDNVEITFPEKVFYEDFYMDLSVQNDTIYLHNETVPVHSNFNIAIDSKKYSDQQMTKMFIGKINDKKTEYLPTTRKGNIFYAKTRTLGTYCLTSDTTAPNINMVKPIQGLDLSKVKNIVLKISDNLSGIKSYNGYLNGQWILFEYEYKQNKLTFNMQDANIANGRNDLKVEVVDNLGNSAIFETWFNFFNK